MIECILSPDCCLSGTSLRAKVIELRIARVKKWKNIVNVCAAPSSVNRNELTYVKGRIPKGKAKKTVQAADIYISYILKSANVVKIVG